MSRERIRPASRHVEIPTSVLEESHMFRLHRLAPTVAVALATAALLAPSAQAMPAVAGGASGGGLTAVDRHAHDTPLANPVSVPTTTPVETAVAANQDRDSGGGGHRLERGVRRRRRKRAHHRDVRGRPEPRAPPHRRGLRTNSTEMPRGPGLIRDRALGMSALGRAGDARSCRAPARCGCRAAATSTPRGRSRGPRRPRPSRR